jgi:hypothetical protein
MNNVGLPREWPVQRVNNPSTGHSLKLNNYSGQCQCIEGFSPSMDVITHPIKNPSQQCQRDCDKVNNNAKYNI